MIYTWLTLFIIFVIVELITYGLVTIWFAFGALVAFLISFITDSNLIQCVGFFGVSIITLLFTRPVVKKYLTPKIVKTNYDKVIGMIGIVTKDIKKDEYGEVKVDGKYWTAKADKKILRDSEVEILAIDGVKLIVKEKENEK